MNPIYDPTTQTVNTATNVVTRQLFPNNQIPSRDVGPGCQEHPGATTRSPIWPGSW